MKLEDYCAKLDKQLAGLSEDARLEGAMQAVSKVFGVGTDEVALLTRRQNDPDLLHFLWPLQLCSAGYIPLSAHNSLAVRTIRDNSPYSNNRFANEPHTVIFEHVKLGNAQRLPIQKIISAPLALDKSVKGVIQVSRKGEDQKSVPDFSEKDLLILSEIAKVLVRHF